MSSLTTSSRVIPLVVAWPVLELIPFTDDETHLRHFTLYHSRIYLIHQSQRWLSVRFHLLSQFCLSKFIALLTISQLCRYFHHAVYSNWFVSRAFLFPRGFRRLKFFVLTDTSAYATVSQIGKSSVAWRQLLESKQFLKSHRLIRYTRCITHWEPNLSNLNDCLATKQLAWIAMFKLR